MTLIESRSGSTPVTSNVFPSGKLWIAFVILAGAFASILAPDALAETSPTTMSGPMEVQTQPDMPFAGEGDRYSGLAGDGLYWSLRSAGVPAQAADDYLSALATRIDTRVGIEPGDRFDLVLHDGRLLYASINRQFGRDVEILRWTSNAGSEWVEPNGRGEARKERGLARPLSGRISSNFGTRIHPIFGFARFHRGVDFAASWGTPIAAAADGQVIFAGWHGGYGRQVRIAHENGTVTTYSHMSSIAAVPGRKVSRGATIGQVGSSGFSTGPHLHYEVLRQGVAIDPLRASILAGRSTPSMRDASIVRARIAGILKNARPAA